MLILDLPFSFRCVFFCVGAVLYVSMFHFNDVCVCKVHNNIVSPAYFLYIQSLYLYSIYTVFASVHFLCTALQKWIKLCVYVGERFVAHTFWCILVLKKRFTEWSWHCCLSHPNDCKMCRYRKAKYIYNGAHKSHIYI